MAKQIKELETAIAWDVEMERRQGSMISVSMLVEGLHRSHKRKRVDESFVE